MKRTETVIIGGGQAGLAMSHCLSDRGVGHVVLERGRVAERWRSERWDSLRLLTPNWQSRLPGQNYGGPDPDGYMTMPEVVRYLEDYARDSAAPVETGVSVTSVERGPDGFRVGTDRGSWSAATVVVATGQCDRPFVPAMAAELAPSFTQLVPSRYRNPRQLPRGGVLVVGASASGLQLADEIHRSGRPVTLAVGRHTRLPRRYRGRDILNWLDAMGSLDETPADVHDPARSRDQPSLQLVGSLDARSLDLDILQRRGVRLVGRAQRAAGERMYFADDLLETTAAADRKLTRVLDRIDAFVARAGMEREVPGALRLLPVRPAPAPAALDLREAGIETVLWATGFRRSYPWLRVGVLDERGEIRHDGGITPEPGLYVIGLQFLRHRNSSFIGGVGSDAADLAHHICRALACPRRAVA